MPFLHCSIQSYMAGCKALFTNQSINQSLDYNQSIKSVRAPVCCTTVFMSTIDNRTTILPRRPLALRPLMYELTVPPPPLPCYVYLVVRSILFLFVCCGVACWVSRLGHAQQSRGTNPPSPSSASTNTAVNLFLCRRHRRRKARAR